MKNCPHCGETLLTKNEDPAERYIPICTEYIKEHGPSTVSELAKACGVSRKTVRKHLVRQIHYRRFGLPQLDHDGYPERWFVAEKQCSKAEYDKAHARWIRRQKAEPRLERLKRHLLLKYNPQHQRPSNIGHRVDIPRDLRPEMSVGDRFNLKFSGEVVTLEIIEFSEKLTVCEAVKSSVGNSAENNAS